jgi:hypothetical protein
MSSSPESGRHTFCLLRLVPPDPPKPRPTRTAWGGRSPEIIRFIAVDRLVGVRRCTLPLLPARLHCDNKPWRRLETELLMLRQLFKLLPYTPQVIDTWQRIAIAQSISGRKHVMRSVAMMQVHSVMFNRDLQRRAF